MAALVWYCIVYHGEIRERMTCVTFGRCCGRTGRSWCRASWSRAGLRTCKSLTMYDTYTYLKLLRVEGVHFKRPHTSSLKQSRPSALSCGCMRFLFNRNKRNKSGRSATYWYIVMQSNVLKTITVNRACPLRPLSRQRMLL